MRVTQSMKNFFVLGWGFGALGVTGYNMTLKSKEPTPINQEILKNTALTHKGTDFYYKFKNRQDHLKEATEQQQEYDLVIIGGGANGSGVFLEAASRGLKCLLLESNDFAAGTSSKSTKLIHGGIRYLQQVFEFSTAGGRKEKYDLVQEGLKERTYFIENAYYMNKSLPLVIPSTNILQTAYLYAGVVVYHFIYLFTADKDTSFRFKFPVIFGKQQLQSHFTNLDEKYKYGVVYEDGQFNDTRMNIDILLTGTIDNYQQGLKGGNILNYAEVKDLLKNQENNEVEGVVFEDKINNKQYNIKAKAVVNCAGVFSDQIRKMDNPECGKRIIPVGGSHVTFPLNYGNKKYGLVIPETKDGRIVFLLPWQRHQLVGTTEQSFDEPVLNPKVSFDEMVFLVDEMSNLYPKLGVQNISDNIKSKWCGLRPLILNKEIKEGEKVNTKAIARKHVIEKSKNNLFTLMGGKWTAYRAMGEETVDQVVEHLIKTNKISKENIQPETQSKFLRLSGEFLKQKDINLPNKRDYSRFFSKLLQEKYEYLEKSQTKYLIKTYGDRSFDIMKLCQQNPEYKQKIHQNHPFIKAEIAYHIQNEMAQTPIDVIFRRTRMGFVDRVAVQESIPTIIDIFAKELKWDQKLKEEKLKETFKIVQEYDF